MKKRKIYEISVIDKTYSKTISDETKFYTSDTALELAFELKETEYNFESAEIVLLNIDDRSLVTRQVSKIEDGFAYELDDDIIAHYGDWRGQLRFEQAGEVYVSSPVKFRIENDLSNDRPPQLSDVQSWVSLKRYADSLTEELKQAVMSIEGIEDTFNENENIRQTTFETAEQSRQTTFETNESERSATFNTNETTRQENEDARIEAEQQREETVANIETRQTFVEDQFNAINQELTTKDVISAPEIIAARNGESDLKTRIDKDHQEVTAQLAQTELQLDNRINIVDAKKIDKNRGDVTSADLSQEVKEQMTGGSVAVVGENAVNTINLMDEAVTSEKIKDGIITEEKLAFQLKPMRVKVDTPVGFNWSYHPLVDKIYTDGEGNFKVDGFDINQYKISGKAYYVDGAGGSNRNDGLTMNTAFQTIYKAAEMPDVDVIRIKGGRYARNRLIRFPIERDITIESWDETPVEMSMHENLTWTKENGYANVYKSSRTFGYMAIDTNYKDEHGNYVPYTTVGSVEEVDSTPGSFYTDLETVYVHSIDNRPVDNKILVLLIVQNIKQSGGYNIFLDNIHVLGGSEPVATTKTDDSIPNIYAKNSRFLYSDRGAGGLSADGVGNAFLQNCHAAYNAKDGFNYHTSVVDSKIIEINCLGYRNGKLGSGDQDNGSTLHDGMKGIRIGGAYYENVGPNVHDIYTGAQSWNLGLFAGKSKGAHELRNADYYVENNAESWFDSCVSYGSNLSVRTVNGTTTKANIRNTQLFDREQIAAGSIDTY